MHRRVFAILFLFLLMGSANPYSNPPSIDWKIKVMQQYDSTPGEMVVRDNNLKQLYYEVFDDQIKEEIERLYRGNEYISSAVGFTFFSYYVVYGELPAKSEFSSSIEVIKHVMKSLRGMGVELDYRSFESAIERFSIDDSNS